MTSPPAFLSAWLLLLPALLAGFFLPGYLTTLRLPTPARAFTSVIASLLLLLANGAVGVRTTKRSCDRSALRRRPTPARKVVGLTHDLTAHQPHPTLNE